MNKDKEDIRFELLKNLLLEEQRKELDQLRNEVLEEKNYATRVNPLVDQKIEVLREKFPEYFGDTITETIKYQIKNSQDEVVEALYPIIGKLIKKSIISEISKLSEKINRQIKESFSFKEKLKRFFSNKKKPDGDVIINDVFQPSVEEVFIIEKDSGLLLGSFSKGNVKDEDIISGMLTAIKSFAEDAFSKSDQNLESVKFETFQLSLHNFKSIYKFVQSIPFYLS